MSLLWGYRALSAPTLLGFDSQQILPSLRPLYLRAGGSEAGPWQGEGEEGERRGLRLAKVQHVEVKAVTSLSQEEGHK